MKFDVWSVRISVPKDDAKGRRWVGNLTFTVVAPTLERALELVREKEPDCTFWGANHKGSEHTLWDGALLTQMESSE